MLFGIGLSVPLLAIAYGLRGFIQTRRANLFVWNKVGMKILGGSIALVGTLMLTGADKYFESQLSSVLPTWFLQISSSL